MKKLTLLITMFVLVFGMTQCTKNRPNLNNNVTYGNRIFQHVTLNTENNGNAKVSMMSLTDKLGLKWDGNEKIYVYDSEGLCGTLNFSSYVGEDKSKATFVGNINPLEGSKIVFWHFNNVAEEDVPGFQGNTKNVTRDYENQEKGADIDEIIYDFDLVTPEIDINSDGIYNGVVFGVPFAVVRINFRDFNTANNITVTGMSSTGYTVDNKGVITFDTKTSSTYTLPGTTDFYAVFMPTEDKREYRFSDGENEAYESWLLEKNTYYTKKETEGDPVEIKGTIIWDASVETLGVYAKHGGWGGNTANASCGGKVTGTGVEEQGVCVVEKTSKGDPTINDKCYVNTSLPKSETVGNTYTSFMNELKPSTQYKVRAYIKKGNAVKYGQVVEFTTSAVSETAMVDLGLESGTKWAVCNLGGTNNYDFGDYYMWGDCACCNDLNINCGWQSYKFAANADAKFSKYCFSTHFGSWYNYQPGTNDPDGITVLENVDDCAQQTLGGSWYMPTSEDWTELINNTTQTKTVVGGVNGWLFTSTVAGYADKSIFFPAAGWRDQDYLYQDGTGYKGAYLSKTLNDYADEPSQVSVIMDFDVDHTVYPNRFVRYAGTTVRPVYKSVK